MTPSSRAASVQIRPRAGRTHSRRALLTRAIAVACLLAAFVVPATAFAVNPIVTFPDAALNAAVHTQMGIPLATPIYASDLTTLTTLTAENKGITLLDGLENAKNLTYLDLWSNNVTTITPLAGCPALGTMVLVGNHISDLTPLASIPHVYYLNIDSNEATTLAGLENQTSLQAVYASSNHLTSISQLQNMPNLEHADFFENDIADITPLRGKTQLKTVAFGMTTSLTDVSALATDTAIQTLYLGYCYNLQGISPLAGLTNLNSLNLYSCSKVVDISALGNLTKLNWLNIEECSVYDITPLRNLNGDAKDTVRMRGNWLDLTPGSDSAQTVSGLISKGYDVVSDPQRPGGAIVGVVRDGVSGKLLGGVLAKLADGPRTVSGANGAYQIGLAEPGTRTLTFTKPHYTVVPRSFALSMGATSTVNVALAPTLLTPTLKRLPSASSVTYKRKKGVAKFTLAVTLSDAVGAAPGIGVWLQKRTSSKKKWTTLYKLTTNARGNASKAFAVKKKGTTYYRWVSVATTLDRSVTSKSQTVKVR